MKETNNKYSTAKILVGLPGTGKSTYVESILKEDPGVFVCSTDNLIEQWAAEEGRTYNDLQAERMDAAYTMMLQLLDEAIEARRNIVWDQTNLGVGKRAKIIQRFESEPYTLEAIVFQVTDEDLWQQRLESRSEFKRIGEDLIATMKLRYVVPELIEGFDAVTVFDQNGLQVSQVKGNGRQMRAEILAEQAARKQADIEAIVQASITEPALAELWTEYFGSSPDAEDVSIPNKEIPNWLSTVRSAFQKRLADKLTQLDLKWEDIDSPVVRLSRDFFLSHNANNT